MAESHTTESHVADNYVVDNHTTNDHVADELAADDHTAADPQIADDTYIARGSFGADRGDGSAHELQNLAARPPKYERTARVRTQPLRQSPGPLWIVLVYIGIALSGWIITCKASESAYGQDNRSWITAAKVLRSISGVLAIPVTTAICTRAAVIYTQRRPRGRRGPTLRQVMVLADKAWADPQLVWHLVNWRRSGSGFLLGAVLLTLLGSIISPLQAGLTSSKSIKISSKDQYDYVPLSPLVDIPDAINQDIVDEGAFALLARESLASATNVQPQSRLWAGDLKCDETSDLELSIDLCTRTAGQFFTFGNMSLLPDPFWATLPYGFNTGMERAYLPRITSTASQENITADDFPKNCDTIQDALYLRYAATGDAAYSVEVCMPANMTISPWIAQHSAQAFTEKLYLNITVGDSGGTTPLYPQESYSMITMQTTTGYFELPNYMNGGVAGPLINEIPDAPILKKKKTRSISNVQGNSPSNETVHFQNNAAKGPLFNVVLALFGASSFIDAQHNSLGTYDLASGTQPSGACVGSAPFVKLLRNDDGEIDLNFDPVDSDCIEDGQVQSTGQYQQLLQSYAYAFVPKAGDGYNGGGRLENAFTAAAFVANDVWMTTNTEIGSLQVTYDPGVDVYVQVISLGAIIVISALLGIYLLSLLLLATVATFTASWAPQLDSFAVMRMAATLGGALPLKMAHGTREIGVLDETPGWVGDAGSDVGPNKGQLELGASEPLDRKKEYVMY